MALIYGVSVAVHLGLAGGMLAVTPKPRQERVAIMVREIKKDRRRGPLRRKG